VAAKTERIKLGTSVLNSLLQSPLLLARRFATLDQLSGGRAVAGIGQGWMPEEYEASGVPMSRRGAGFEEHIAAMRASWGPNPVEYTGRFYEISRAEVGPKPVNGRVPLLIGASSRSAVERAARLGDGFAAVFLGWESTCEHLDWYRKAGGTGPIVLRVNPEHVDGAAPSSPFAGPAPSIRDDIARAAAAGVGEIFFDLNHVGLDVSEQIDYFTALATGLKS
jgi:alkanesulfonate monooxygenase SsuD/methylene tetrahydromethanopterin reductase-like flavin-dependent oxidoreductase (luciferase family)